MITKDDFFLNPEICFLNNGSFGACPKVVFSKYQEWQRVVEFQPVDFYVRDLLPELKKARDILGAFIKTEGDNLILTHNATFATNMSIRSLDLTAEDEVIITNHEYGACLNAWEFWQREKGFKIRIAEFNLPFPETDEIIEQFSSLINENTKVIFFSHITSRTAQIFPAKEICALARKNNIISIVDAAHAIGQYENLDISDIDPDFYYSNIHKWLFAPKGTAFIYTRKNLQNLVQPLVTGWGWGEERVVGSGNDYINSNQYYGTNDLSSYLTIPAAISFYKENNLYQKKQDCHDLIEYFLSEVVKITGKQSLYTDSSKYLMMAVFEVPKKYTSAELIALLHDKYLIEIPVLEWQDKLMLRISIQIYNTRKEVDYLLETLKKIYS